MRRPSSSAGPASSAPSTASSTTSAIAYQADFDELSDEQWDEMWQLNVMSFVRAIRAVLPGMRERGRGVIVNVASTSGKRPSTSMPNYSVTKAAVLSLSRLVADLYAKDGIRSNAIAPGPTATDAWLAPGGLADQQAKRTGKSRDEVLEAVGQGTPARPAREARRDRRRDRLPVLGPCQLRDGFGVERRRRNCPHHHLAWRNRCPS